MAYCIFRKQNIHTKAVLQQAYNHQFRFSSPENADKDYEALNDVAVAPEQNYVHAFQRRINELPYYQNHDIRKNAVLAYDIILAYSAEASNWLDKEKWKEDNLKWLYETFGKENVLGVVYHYDEAANIEAGAIHGHAVVVPIDDNGKLNASYYTGSKDHLRQLQDSYAKAMAPHNLERGLKHTAAMHSTVKEFYAKLNDAVYGTPMPERIPGQSTEKYIEKVKDAWRTERAAHLRELRDKDREIMELKAERPTETQKDIRINEMEKRIKEMEESQAGLEHEFGSLENTKNLAHAMRLLNMGIEEHPDDGYATRTSEYAASMIEWAEQRERKKEKDISHDEKSEPPLT